MVVAALKKSIFALIIAGPCLRGSFHMIQGHLNIKALTNLSMSMMLSPLFSFGLQICFQLTLHWPPETLFVPSQKNGLAKHYVIGS
jgi:hypothetical protein